jgi:hypothetical protein
MNFIIGTGYLALFILCLLSLSKAAYRVTPEHLTGYRIIWVTAAIVILLTLISSVFDIPKTFMDNIRIIALKQGWYNVRYSFQIIFLVGICAIIFMAAVVNEVSMSGLFVYNRHVMRWLILLIGFNLINTISFHYVDQIMNMRIIGCRMERWFEILIILLMLISLTRKHYSSLKRSLAASHVSHARFI